MNAFWLEQASKAGAKLRFQWRLVSFDLDVGWCDFKPTAATADANIFPTNL